MLGRLVRSQIRGLLTREKEVVLEPGKPSLEAHFQKFEELGIYLHIPFCEQICPYCPYNKEIYDPDVAERYAKAIIAEIDLYAGLIGDKPVTSFYIGGGTPTTMLYNGLPEILDHLRVRFDIRCDIHLESHPNHLSPVNLDIISSLGINHLSIGVESLQDSVNADMIFALPDQSYDEVEQTGRALADMAVDQVAAYPLFIFPYTHFGSAAKKQKYKNSRILKRRKMLGILENIFYDAGFERTSVWAFTRKDVPKYCSVTVPLYVGLGASGGSYLKDIFYLNTFRVAEYINALEDGRLPIALSIDLSENLQMAGWLYWRIYETKFLKEDFEKRFGRDFDTIYSRYIKLLSFMGLLTHDDDRIVLTDRGSFWLHALEDLYSINYIGKLWGELKQEPWPRSVAL
jgi:oxygen-independent coproporphyrinogen-3 oxidase